MNPIAVYVHIPFCPSKCGYCDFNSYAMEGEIMERTTRAIIAEIERSEQRGRPAKSLFFGGGTPTFLSAAQLLRILDAVVCAHPPTQRCEITSEANPGTADAGKFKQMRTAGFNRLSLGAQSFQDGELLRLGRIHKSDETVRAVASAREAGFTNLNLDLMFALPNQTDAVWQDNLYKALALNPEHLSLYCLTIEPNTAFYKQQKRGMLTVPNEEAQIRMYESCAKTAAQHGLFQYEISNYAKPGFECVHNLTYWRGEEYAAYGPGAVSRIGSVRQTRVKHPARYCEAVENGFSLYCEQESLTENDLRTEKIMLGLRLNRGVNAEVLDAQAANRVIARGWIEKTENRFRLTPEGRRFCNQAILELI